MGLLGVRVVIWLLVVCVPAQASAALSLRAKGPAHAHVEVPSTARSTVQAIDERDAEHDPWHAHEHENSHAAHHDHDEDDDSVVLIASPGDGEHGAGKASVIEMPGVLPPARGIPIAPARPGLSNAAAVAFESRAGLPLYRPPR